MPGDTADRGAAATDWAQILQLYDQLLAVAPSPVVALHRAVAVAEVDGPARALALVDELGASAGQGSGPSLAGYHLFHAIRADLLRRLGRTGEAAAAYDAALARTANAAERDFLRRRRPISPQSDPSPHLSHPRRPGRGHKDNTSHADHRRPTPGGRQPRVAGGRSKSVRKPLRERPFLTTFGEWRCCYPPEAGTCWVPGGRPRRAGRSAPWYSPGRPGG